MIVAEIKENVFVPFEKKEYDILIHGSNCFHTMSGNCRYCKIQIP